MSGDKDMQGGFTLVELLVVLALAAVITGLLANGIIAIRKNWLRVESGTHEELDPALQRLGSMLRNTRVAYSVQSSTRPAALLFDGRADQLTFVTLSEGYALQGGLVRIRLASELGDNGQRVSVNAAVYRSNDAEMKDGQALVLFGDINSFRLRYFGSEGDGVAPSWRSEWTGRRTLPWFVEVQVGINEAGSERSIAVPLELRHGFRANGY